MTSFAPIIGLEPKVLILGSMPSQISLKEQQYYANPANAFWWIMSRMLGFSMKLDYAERSQRVSKAGFAVWDVLYDCERIGSLDSNIKRASEQPNDIASLLKRNPSLTKIGFNGQAAQRIFNRHIVLPEQKTSVHLSSLKYGSLQYCLLPSTSSAHATKTKQQKLQAWSSALTISAADVVNNKQ